MSRKRVSRNQNRPKSSPVRTGRIRRSSAATSGAVKAAVIGAIATLLAAGIGAAVVLSQQGGPSSTFASALQVVDMQVIDK